MNTLRPHEAVIAAWLEDGPLTLPAETRQAITVGIRTISRRRAGIAWPFAGPQRRLAWLPGREQMNRMTYAIGAVAAIVIVVAAGAYYLAGRGPGIGASPSPAPSPSPTVLQSVSPSLPGDHSLPVGSSHVLFDHAQEGLKIVVTIPAAGWFGDAGRGVLTKDGSAGAPDGAEVTVFAMTNYGIVGTGDVYVYGDPCHWASPTSRTRVTTVDEAIAALSAQPSRDASAPEVITYDGYAGKYINLHVPDDAVFADCDEGQFRTLAGTSGNPGESATRAEDPGQFDLFRVLDVDGQLVIFDLAFFEGAEGTPESVLNEMAAIMESAIFESYDP
jgi:hypothetical protein